MFLYFCLLLLLFFLFLQLPHNPTKKSILEYLFVTAYFHVENNGKHSLTEYKTYINNFFSLINKSVAVFTDNNISSKSIIPTHVVVYKYEYKSIWDVSCIKRYKNAYINQHKIDPENFRHSPDVYAIWNSKICFLETASNDINSKLYIWIDIGSVRQPSTFRIFPSLKAINMLYNFHSMFFFTISNRKFRINKIKELVAEDWIEGTSFGGNKLSIRKYYKEFWELHDFFLNKNQFVGKEQILYNTMALYIENVTLIKLHDINMCIENYWWRFQCFYAGIDLNYLINTDIINYIIR